MYKMRIGGGSGAHFSFGFPSAELRKNAQKKALVLSYLNQNTKNVGGTEKSRIFP